MHTQSEIAALADKDYRQAYVDDHVRFTLAYQIRCIREKMGLSQKAFGRLIGKPASVVSRLENTDYGKVTVQTVLDIAGKLDIAVVVKFASFPEFLRSYDDVSPASLAVANYHETYNNNAIGSATPALTLAVSASGVSSQAQMNQPRSSGIFYGEPTHTLTSIVSTGGVAAIFGLTVTPFAILPNPIYGEISHV